MPGSAWLEAQTLPAPSVDPTGELEARETRWWLLHPGEPGYNQPLHEYLGFTEQQWREQRMFRGFR